MNTRLIQVIALILYAIFDWKMVVVGGRKCGIGEFCNFKDCNTMPDLNDDENKLDKACLSNRCKYVEPHGFWKEYSYRCDTIGGICKDGQYCISGCTPAPQKAENVHCAAGLNCDRITLKCVKKPPPAKCKAGEYCHLADCWAKPAAADANNADCESNKCDEDFICEEVEEEDDGVPNQNEKEIQEEENRKYWIILAVVILILDGALSFLIWFYCCHKKGPMNNTSVNEKEKGKKFKQRNSSKVSSKSKKSAVSNMVENS